MSEREFYEKVKKLRLAQKTYLSHRTADNLRTARILEHEIDKEIESMERCIRLCLPNRFSNENK